MPIVLGHGMSCMCERPVFTWRHYSVKWPYVSVRRPQLLLVGNVTVDLVDGKRALVMRHLALQHSDQYHTGLWNQQNVDMHSDDRLITAVSSMQGGAVAYAAAVASALGVRACVVTGQRMYMCCLDYQAPQGLMVVSMCVPRHAITWLGANGKGFPDRRSP